MTARADGKKRGERPNMIDRMTREAITSIEKGEVAGVRRDANGPATVPPKG